MKRKNSYLKIIIPPLLSLGILSAQGCLSFRSSPGGIEPSAGPLKSTEYEIMGKSSASASNFTLLHFFTVTPEPDLDRAISEAVSRLEGDDLINVRWWIDRKIYILGTIQIVHVSGDVIRYNTQ